MDEFRILIRNSLDDYYGGSRDDIFKEGVIDFIENYSQEIHEAIHLLENEN